MTVVTVCPPYLPWGWPITYCPSHDCCNCLTVCPPYLPWGWPITYCPSHDCCNCLTVCPPYLPWGWPRKHGNGLPCTVCTHCPGRECCTCPPASAQVARWCCSSGCCPSTCTPGIPQTPAIIHQCTVLVGTPTLQPCLRCSATRGGHFLKCSGCTATISKSTVSAPATSS